MSVIGKKSQSALLAKYYSQYKKKPRSRVFAPLAESFRRLGMMEDAYKVLKEGIKHNPNYPLGYVVLAHCYFDQEKFDLAYHTLRPLVSAHPDNISMQKIFAESCLKIGHNEEALETYKYLLFLNPRDKFFAEQVKKLEDDLLIGHKVLTADQLIKAPDLELVQKLESIDDDWVQVDFNEKIESPHQVGPTKIDIPNDDDWVMTKPEATVHPILKNENIEKRDLEDDYYADEFENEFGHIEDQDLKANIEAPIISHTLIDLYCAQSYFDKAQDLLEQIIELNPNDEASKVKLNQVKVLRGLKVEESEDTTEEEGHAELISIIENEVKQKTPYKDLLEIKFQTFLNALKERADQIR
jgi:tetratricopeptide (TPR) repeat protein